MGSKLFKQSECGPDTVIGEIHCWTDSLPDNKGPQSWLWLHMFVTLAPLFLFFIMKWDNIIIQFDNVPL